MTHEIRNMGRVTRPSTTRLSLNECKSVPIELLSTKSGQDRADLPRPWYITTVVVFRAHVHSGGHDDARALHPMLLRGRASLPLWLESRQEAFVMCIPMAWPALAIRPSIDRRPMTLVVSPSRVVHLPRLLRTARQASKAAACLSGDGQRQPWGSPTAIPISDLHRHGLSPSLAGNVPTN